MWKMHFSFVCLNNLGVSGKYHLDWIKLSYKPKLLHACVSGQETKQIISENQIVKNKIRNSNCQNKTRKSNCQSPYFYCSVLAAM